MQSLTKPRPVLELDKHLQESGIRGNPQKWSQLTQLTSRPWKDPSSIRMFARVGATRMLPTYIKEVGGV
jgi:hypothetical protein